MSKRIENLVSFLANEFKQYKFVIEDDGHIEVYRESKAVYREEITEEFIKERVAVEDTKNMKVETIDGKKCTKYYINGKPRAILWQRGLIEFGDGFMEMPGELEII